MNTTTTTAPDAGAANRTHDDLEKSLKDLADLGRVWARYGLDIGGHALATTAKTLAVTSTLLTRLGEEIAPVDAATSPVATATPPTP